MLREKLWTLVSVYALIGGATAILITADLWLFVIFFPHIINILMVLFLSALLLPVGVFLLYAVPQGQSFPRMAQLWRRPEPIPPYAARAPPPGPYIVYTPPVEGRLPPGEWADAQPPRGYVIDQATSPYPPAYAPPPIPGYGYRPERAVGPTWAPGHEVQAPPPEAPPRPPAGPGPRPTPPEEPVPAAEPLWAEVPPWEGPPPVPPAGPSPPVVRADGRPVLEMFGFQYFLVGFLVAVTVGTVTLLYRDSLPRWTDAALLMPSLVVAFSFPCLMWISYVHQKRVGEPEPRSGLLTVLAGGMMATLVPLYINTIVAFASPEASVVVSAPIVEEVMKALILLLVIQEINSRYDGLIYGVTIGMGFALLENLIYSMTPLLMGGPPEEVATLWGSTALVRGLTSTLVHAAGTGLVGYVLGAFLDPEGPPRPGILVKAMLGAIGLHMGWNGLLQLTGLIGHYAALTLVVILWPMLAFWIIYTLMGMGRTRGERFPGGGRWHRPEPPEPAPVYSVAAAPGGGGGPYVEAWPPPLQGPPGPPRPPYG